MRQANRGQFEKIDGSNLQIGIVIAQFNQDITQQLLTGALRTLELSRVKPANIKVFNVPGCVEIPLILAKLAATKKYHALIALGAVIKGETAHFDYVCKIVSEGILRIMLDYEIPIGFGILTVNNHKQAQARVDSGAAAAQAALQSVKIIKSIN